MGYGRLCCVRRSVFGAEKKRRTIRPALLYHKNSINCADELIFSQIGQKSINQSDN
jgi:hypothetical protein